MFLSSEMRREKELRLGGLCAIVEGPLESLGKLRNAVSIGSAARRIRAALSLESSAR